jgi:Uma2 family endonuclease
MADNTVQFQWITTIKGGLDAAYRTEELVFVAGDLFWYPVESDATIRVAPDVLVAVGRPKGDRGSYLQWLEDNVAPQVVFEILSPGNRPTEMVRKFRFYERYGVEEYYVFDPEHGVLDGWLRADGELREIPEMNGWVSPRLKIRFELTAGTLKIHGPDGQPFATYVELVEQRERERHEKERERHEKERERHEKERERARADRLAAQIRAMGGEPEA